MILFFDFKIQRCAIPSFMKHFFEENENCLIHIKQFSIE